MPRGVFPPRSTVYNIFRAFQPQGVWEAIWEELRAALRSNNKALPGINGDESWELPVPATYVIARDGRIALAYIEVDYRIRLEPEALLNALRSLQPS